MSLIFESYRPGFSDLFTVAPVQQLPDRTAITACTWHRGLQRLILVSGQGAITQLQTDGSQQFLCKCGEALRCLNADCVDRLVYTKGTSARIDRSYTDGTGMVTIAAGFEDQPFAQLTNISIHSNGMLYFADCRADGTSAVYFANPIGLVALKASTDVIAPQAVCVSADQRYVYIADPAQRFVTKFQIASNGTLEFKQLCCYLGDDADQLQIVTMLPGEDGTLYVVTSHDIRVYDCDGMALGRIVFDAEITAACLGGKTLDKLYLFQGSTLQTFTLSVPGSAFVR